MEVAATLSFYLTETKLPHDKIRSVVAGYTMILNCQEHAEKNTPLNPHLNWIQEFIIDSEEYPCAMLYPWGYVTSHKFVLGQYPENTILYYKQHVEPFMEIKEKFLASPANSEFWWPCGCLIRKLTNIELETHCNHPWYPWIGERESACYYDGIWFPPKPTNTAKEIMEVLKDAGIVSLDKVKAGIEVIESHRSRQ